MSNELMKRYKGLRKADPKADFEELKAPLRDALRKALPPFPEAMIEEVWQYFIFPAQNQDDLEKASDFVEFCHDNLELDRSLLEEEDWLFIRDIVNMFALDLDLDFVSFVMTVIVNKGLISKT